MIHPVLDIKNLAVSLVSNNKSIVHDVSLTINPGEVHVIMGPNGSGKSTLAYTLSRHHNYEITNGDVYLNNNSIKNLSPDECAQQGLFLSLQYPISIPGVSNIQFLKTATNAIRTARNLPIYDSFQFLNIVKKTMLELDMSEDFLSRQLNEGFSGGEKKRNEILQMILLEPKIAILDETDSGLDIDSLQVVAKGINSQRDGVRSFLLITHYQRLLDYIKPDFIHVMMDGKIVKSGNADLAQILEEKGYAWLQGAVNA